MKCLFVSLFVFVVSACASVGSTDEQSFDYRNNLAEQVASGSTEDCICYPEYGQIVFLEDVEYIPWPKDLRRLPLEERARSVAKNESGSSDQVKIVSTTTSCWTGDCGHNQYHIFGLKDVKKTWILVNYGGTAHKCTFAENPHEWTNENCPAPPKDRKELERLQNKLSLSRES